MEIRANNKTDILQRYFGYSVFRKGQENIIDSLLSGRDALAICRPVRESRSAIRFLL